jgi:hypothetical protein
MKRAIHLEHRASSSWSKHEGEPSFALCDRLDRTRDNSPRQLPTDHDYAVPTREYQTDQSSLKPAQAAARSVLGEKRKQRQKQPHRLRRVDRVTPYQSKPLTKGGLLAIVRITPANADGVDDLRYQTQSLDFLTLGDIWGYRYP